MFLLDFKVVLIFAFVFVALQGSPYFRFRFVALQGRPYFRCCFVCTFKVALIFTFFVQLFIHILSPFFWKTIFHKFEKYQHYGDQRFFFNYRWYSIFLVRLIMYAGFVAIFKNYFLGKWENVNWGNVRAPFSTTMQIQTK